MLNIERQAIHTTKDIQHRDIAVPVFFYVAPFWKRIHQIPDHRPALPA